MAQAIEVGHRLETVKGHAKSSAPLAEAARRRVIFVNRFFHPDLSATSQLLTDLVRELPHEDFELHVVCSRQLYANSRTLLPTHEVIDGVHVHRVWSMRFGRDRLLGRGLDYLSFFICSAAELAGCARRRDVIVAMTDPPLIGVCAAVIARRRGAVLINWLQICFPRLQQRWALCSCRSQLLER